MVATLRKLRSHRAWWLGVVLLGVAAAAPAARDGTDLLVLDARSNQILRVHAGSGRIAGVFVPPESGGLRGPRAATFGPDGQLYVASFDTDQVLRYDGRTGRFLGVFAADAALSGPSDLAFGPDGGLFVAAVGGILQFDPAGALVGRVGGDAAHRVPGSLALAVGGDGLLYVAGSDADEILRIDASDDSAEVFVNAGSGVIGVQALRFGGDGHLYAASRDAGGIVRFDGETGAYLDTFLRTRETAGAPVGFTLGPDDTTYVAGDRALLRYGHGRPSSDFRLAGDAAEAGSYEPVGVLALGADLVVSAIKAPASPARGAAATISDTVKNQGIEGAGGSTTRLYLSANATIDAGDTVLGSRTVPALAPSLTSIGNTGVVIPAGIPAGKYSIIARADADDAIAEANEGNNTKVKAIKIGPDLAVKSLAAPGSIQAGTPFDVTDTTQNLGGEQAPPTETRFFLSTDAKAGGGDVLLGGRSVPALNPKGTSTATTSLTVPAGTAVRVWYLLALADGGTDVPESLESNNVKAVLTGLASGPPVSAAGPDQDVARGTTVALDGGGSSDPDGQPLTWTWTQVYGPDVTGGAGVLSGAVPMFTSPAAVSTLLFDLRVSDGTYTSAPDRVQVNVMEDSDRAIFVATTGSDADEGTRSAPMLTVQAAIDRARTAGGGADLYIAAGVYAASRTIAMAPGVSIYGGFDPVDWVRRSTSATELNISMSPGVLAQNITTPTELSQVTVRGGDAVGVTYPAGNTAYGVKVVNSTALVIRDSTIIAGAGVNGTNGNAGATGRNGLSGTPGAGGFCDMVATAAGGSGGFSYGGRPGGPGGPGGGGATPGTAGGQGAIATLGGPGGAYGDPGHAGGPGADGTNGSPGGNGSGGAAAGFINTSGTDWFAFSGSDGLSGSPGNGGGGGGGGGGQDCWFFCTSGTGNGGGGGGGGGQGGWGGYGGGGGGGSFGIALFSSTGTELVNNVISSGRAGNGGSGGSGAVGGTGGAGADGAVTCSTEVGAGGRGGKGGTGGRGGIGGGGAGGDAFAVLLDNTATSVTGTLNAGLPGTGGGGGTAGAAGAAGTIKTR